MNQQMNLNYQNLHGFKAYCDANRGIAPYFQNMISYRVHKKLSCNIVVTGEPGIGKTYLATDIARIFEGLDRDGKDRFTIDQVAYTFADVMNLELTLGIGKVIVPDEPSYAMGKRDWYKELNKILVQTIESARFKVHPKIIPIINKSLLDKTLRDHLLQYQIVMTDRGKGRVYRIKPSQFVEKVYYQYFCDLEYSLMDMHLCSKDSCLDCDSLMTCNIFRARYERKKGSIQDSRYEQAKEMAQRTEGQKLTLTQLENLSLPLKDKFMKNGKIDVVALRIALQDTYGLHVSSGKGYDLKEGLETHHKEKLQVE